MMISVNSKHLTDQHSSEEIITSLLNIKRDKPAFIFDDLFHFSLRHHKKHINYQNMLPVALWMAQTVAERLRGQKQPGMLIPEAITNGKNYYEIAKEYEHKIRNARDGVLSTYRLAEILPGDLLTLLTEKNKTKAMTRLEGFLRLFPESFLISPSGMEPLLKNMTDNPGFTNFQSLRDEDFEAFWILVCYFSRRGGFADEVAYSRNGNFETFALFQTQYGVLPFRPKGDTDVYFPNGQIVRPSDYLKILLDHLVDVLPHGFTSDLSVKMAVRMMMLEEMRAQEITHPYWGKLDPARINPKLMRLGKGHDKEFQDVSENVIAIMEEHNHGPALGDLFGFDADNEYDRLGGFYREKVNLLQAKKATFSLSKIGEEASAWAHENLSMEAALEAEGNLHDLSVKVPYQHDGAFFDKPPVLFDDGLFSRLNERAKLQMKAIMGLHETPKVDRISRRGEVVVLFDRRAGEEGRRYARKFNALTPQEARGLSDDFDQVVREQNIQKVDRAFKRLARHPDFKNQTVTTSETIERYGTYLQKIPESFKLLGPAKISGETKQVAVQEIMRRSTTHFATDKIWVNSAYLTGARLYARKVQMGLVERPKGMEKTGLIVGDYNYSQGIIPKSFREDFEVLSAEMHRLVRAGMQGYPRHVVKGLMEMTLMADIYYNADVNQQANPTGGSPLVDWQIVPMNFKTGLEEDKAAFIALKNEAKELILNYGMNALSYEDIDDQIEKIDRDYRAAKERQGASEQIQKSRRPNDRDYQARRGLTGVSPS